MRILYVVPDRAVKDPNTLREAEALQAAGHDTWITSPRKRFTKVGGVLALRFQVPHVVEALEVDAVMCRDLDTLAAGVRAKRRTGAKVVYWAHDVFQDMVEPDIPALLVRYLECHERKLLPGVDAAIASNEGVRGHLTERRPGLFPTLVMPCRVPEVYFKPPLQRRLSYLGTLHKNRFVKEMVGAMPAIREGFDDPKPSLTIAGPRDRGGLYDWLKAEYGCGPEGFYGGEPVMFLGTLAPDGVLFQVYESDIVVSMLNPEDKCLRVGLANKVFDAMSVGRGAIGTAYTATGDIIEETRMGPAISYDKDDFVATVRMLFEEDFIVEMGLNAYHAGKTKYNWYNEAKKLVSVFENL